MITVGGVTLVSLKLAKTRFTSVGLKGSWELVIHPHRSILLSVSQLSKQSRTAKQLSKVFGIEMQPVSPAEWIAALTKLKEESQ